MNVIKLHNVKIFCLSIINRIIIKFDMVLIIYIITYNNVINISGTEYNYEFIIDIT